MKWTIWTKALLVTIFIGLGACYAQTNDTVLTVPWAPGVNGTVRLTVPFAFSASGNRFDAGEYSFKPGDDARRVTIKAVSGNAVAVILTSSATSIYTQNPKLVFHKYGDKYFLAQVWLHLSDTGQELVISPDEINVARNFHQERVLLMAKK